MLDMSASTSTSARNDESAQDALAPAASPLSLIRRHAPLLLLTLTFAVAFVDRQLLAILQESIKRDLDLSDSQLGLLSGTAFALFYVGFGIPIARLADQCNRRNLIAISLAAWSAMTAATAFAQSFAHMLVARTGVAVGEAGCNPASYSMIADLYHPRHRATATSIYSTGASWGMLAGLLLGGWLEAAVGWRGAFLIVGLPGIALAVFLRLYVREPERKQLAANKISFREGLAYIATRRTLVALGLAVSFSATAAYVPILWGASFFIRVHGYSASEVGVWMAMILGIGAAMAAIGHGMLADRLGMRDSRWRLWLPAAVSLVSLPLWIAGFMTNDRDGAMFLLLAPLVLCNVFSGVLYSVITGLMPPDFRATGTAIFLVFANGAGMGVGVLGVGALSDLLQPAYGVQSIQYALLMVVPLAALLAAASLLWGSLSLRGDQAKVDAAA